MSERNYAVDGSNTLTEFDPDNTQPWDTHTVATDANGTVTANTYDYGTAADWQADHALPAGDVAAMTEASANALMATTERDAFQNDAMGTASPTPFESLDGAHRFDGGSYDIDPGAVDTNPNTPATTIGLEDANPNDGFDPTGLDDDTQGWSYDDVTNPSDPYTYPVDDYDGWDYGDDWGPIVLDLDNDGIDITPRTNSQAFFDVDNDGWFERTAWAGPTDGFLVIDLAANVQFDANGNLTAASLVGDGKISSIYELGFWGAGTDLENLKTLFDSNHNNQLDSGDTHWSKFRVWQDSNGDGWSYDDANRNNVFDAGEATDLTTLAQRGITSVSLVSDHQAFQLPDGSSIKGFSTFTQNGVTKNLADAAFSYNTEGFQQEDFPDGFAYYSESGGITDWYVAGYSQATAAEYYVVHNFNWSASAINALGYFPSGYVGGFYGDTLNGAAVNVALSIYGDEGNDTITGGSADDTLDGGAGVDVVNGGGGDDVIYFTAAEAASINGGTGYDTGIVTSTTALTINMGTRGFESLISGNGADNITAAAGVGNMIDGRGGNDTITGSANDDMITGGVGNDSIVAGAGVDVVIGGAGTDFLSGQDGDDGLFGGEANDTILGGAGNDNIDGGAGADSMTGGIGNDSYVVDDAADIVIEAANEGTDSVDAEITYTLVANVENGAITGRLATNLTGNGLANALTGNFAINVLSGGDGNDTLDGDGGADVLNGGNGIDVASYQSATSGVRASLLAPATNTGDALGDTYTSIENLTGSRFSDSLVGDGEANVIDGGAGADSLDGGLGTDTLSGGAGNDTYYVETYLDVITENANEGTDTVVSTSSFILGANLENLTLSGSGVIDGIGNGLANVITGNAVRNSLAGAGGNDTLIGNDGDDILNGDAGADSMTGGAGVDTYYVDDAGDMVVETDAAATAYDTVWVNLASYTLPVNVEIYIAQPNAGAMSGTGNDGITLMLGNEGANVLNSLGGNDQVLGLDGNDTINGGTGDLDILSGGNGADSLTGGGGHDYFSYESITQGGDTITDFATGAGVEDDILDFRPMWATFTNMAGVTTSAQAVASGHLTYTQAGSNVQVFADANGGADNNILMVTLLNQTAAAVQNYTLI